MAIVVTVKCDTKGCTSEIELIAVCFRSAETEFYQLEEIHGWEIDNDGVDKCPACYVQSKAG
ncbi:hypothetical protein [Enterovibrio nigricans]|uniref:Uncharacterized protein n=1 Tax=Enterovibrio nigricans DSM 22720 TaxID=1121868 RepID=A0A1T4UV59_9GAMM|nr:hypothetical protein [Enterovibrio nigricans]PKF50904.1 hypothetical protein AT251_07740 [Enterovibrio nigricans]SKA56560.1 hypothetical protein SAMN02745132_02583 [Enterovibrio nigricans DSM 22720]